MTTTPTSGRGERRTSLRGRLADHGSEPLRRYGFGEMGVEARVQARQPVFRLAIAGEGDEDDRLARLASAAPTRDLVAVEAGQADVDQGDVGSHGGGDLDARPAVGGLTNVVAFERQLNLEHLASVRIVLDDEDPSRDRGRRRGRCDGARFGGRRNAWQPDREYTALSRAIAPGRDRASVQPDERFRQREADPEAALRPIESALALDEELEYAVTEVRRDPGTGICDLEHCRVSILRQSYRHAATGRRVFQRIADEVLEDLFDPCLVGVDPHRRHLGGDPVPRESPGHSPRAHRARHENAEVQGLPGEPYLPARQPADVEQVVDEMRQMLDLPIDDRAGAR